MVSVPNPNNPKMCREIVFGEGQSPFTPSQQLMKAVVKYEQLYLKLKTSVTVMIRSEHFIRSLGEQVKKSHIKQSSLNQTVDRHTKRLVTTAKQCSQCTRKQRRLVLCPSEQSIQGSSGFIS